MITFEMILGELYAAKLEYYNILKKASILELYIDTNRGNVTYIITSSKDFENDLMEARNEIAKRLNTGSCWIKDYHEKHCLFFDGIECTAKREGSSFLPN